MEALDAVVGSRNQMYNLSTRFCLPIPPYVNSNGVWQFIDKAKKHPLRASLPRLELQIIVAFSVTQACHFVLKRLGIPMIVSQLTAGLILGQAILGLNGYYKHVLFSDTNLGVLDLTATFGYILFLFLMGVKMDVSMIQKTGKKSLVTGLLALLIPFLLGAAATEKMCRICGIEGEDKWKLWVVNVTHSLSPFAGISCLISDLQIINSELGRLGLSCALVSEMLGVILSRVVIWLGSMYRQSLQLALKNLGLMMGYIVLVVFAVRPAMLWVIKQTPEGKTCQELVYSQYNHAGIRVWLFISLVWPTRFLRPSHFGLAVPDGPPLGSALVDKLDPMVSGLLIPLVVTTSSMRVNFFYINLLEDNLVKSTAVIVAVIFLSKVAATMIPPLYCKVPKRDALALALIMSTKGIVEISTYNISRNLETITDQMFSLLTLEILVIAIIVPILVRCLYDPSRKYAGYQKRNIMQHSKASGELRILACIYRPDNIPSIINFLQASCPKEGSPVAVYVLHLINLSGRAAPLFISHKMQKKTVSNRSYSENVILSFKLFEEKNLGTTYVHPFTAISPPKFMHEDVCTLALDKLASIVVVPFHRKWFIEGSIESDDSIKRAMNCSVLERAPCSVGILIDRGHLGGFISRELSLGPCFCVAMIFFGGSDDREALTLAKRMSQNHSINLTVIRYIAKSDDMISTDWEKVLDSEVLKEIKPESSYNQRVNYVVEMVNDGQETLSNIKSVVPKYDLVIVGRRNNVTESQATTGVDTSREFPELGIVGNFLVTEDLPRRYSVLVVQQQQTTLQIEK